MRMASSIVMPLHVRTPAIVKVVDDPGDRFLAGFKWPEVPVATEWQTIIVKMLRLR